MKIGVIEVKQPIGNFYIGKMSAKVLYSLAEADIAKMKKSDDEDYIGSQRQLISTKVSQIKKYLSTSNATFPASIILNLSEQYIIKRTNDYLEIKESNNTFNIIDGQHRLAGFEEGTIDFEIPISIFIGLDGAKQSRIFATINTTQTKVNGSLSLYLENNDPIWTPRKMVVQLAELFTKDIESPFRNRIKFNVISEDVTKNISTISLQAFGFSILELIYDDRDFYLVKDVVEKCSKLNEADKKLDIEKGILWLYYVEHKEGALYKILFNYFWVIQKYFKKEWNDKKSILIKTTGFNAFMKVFKYLYDIGYEKGDLSKEFFEIYISKLSSMDGKFNTNYYGGSGLQATNNLANDLLNLMKINV